jgi:hypothetical protein
VEGPQWQRVRRLRDRVIYFGAYNRQFLVQVTNPKVFVIGRKLLKRRCASV